MLPIKRIDKNIKVFIMPPTFCLMKLSHFDPKILIPYICMVWLKDFTQDYLESMFNQPINIIGE